MSQEPSSVTISAAAADAEPAVRNPHFDDGLVVWSDEYSGRYAPPPTGYSEQFDLQWDLALQRSDYYDYPGASVEDSYIRDRVYEWTGKPPADDGSYEPPPGIRPLDRPVDPALIAGRDCIDIGCGMGRWTRVMQALGARSVLSVDLSPSALKSVARFNANVRPVDVMTIPDEQPDLVERFDFANFWGVAMCTHDPLKAFLSAASTVKPGGALYLMVYGPEGMHATPLVNRQRARFNRLRTVEERLAFVEHVYHRRWDRGYALHDNVKNVLRNVLRRPKGGKVGVLDMLEPYYNWVIPFPVIEGWMARAGFDEVRFLNEHQHPKVAYHVLGIKGASAGA
jgi:SAM-dependent methyltransferase